MNALKLIPSGCLLTITAFMLVSCTNTNQTIEPTIAPPSQQMVMKQYEENKKEPEVNGSVELVPNVKNNAEISSSENEDSENKTEETDSETSDAHSHEEIEKNDSIVIPYNPSKPTLMGFTINQNMNEVQSKLGNPREEYVMEDENDPITVYAYNGFTIGFDKYELVVFIDVSSLQVNPGLNGLRLGNTIEDAIQALGKPTTNTEYVLNYISDDVILKLDVDPTTQTIHSIKLFANK